MIALQGDRLSTSVTTTGTSSIIHDSTVTFAIFEDLSAVSPQSLQLKYFYKTFVPQPIESMLTNCHQLFCKLCLSFPLPI